jgi:hypothetical protein
LENIMREDFSHEVALRAALSIVYTLSATPRMPRQQELATVTDAVLGAIRQVEEAQLAAPLADAEGAVRVWLPLPGGDPGILYLSD